LLASGTKVRTLTYHARGDAVVARQVEVVPFNFDRPDELARSLERATVLFNTYWIRFPHRGVDFDQAVIICTRR
jgi:NADH dehydrogenase